MARRRIAALAVWGWCETSRLWALRGTGLRRPARVQLGVGQELWPGTTSTQIMSVVQRRVVPPSPSIALQKSSSRLGWNRRTTELEALNTPLSLSEASSASRTSTMVQSAFTDAVASVPEQTFNTPARASPLGRCHDPGLPFVPARTRQPGGGAGSYRRELRDLTKLRVAVPVGRSGAEHGDLCAGPLVFDACARRGRPKQTPHDRPASGRAAAHALERLARVSQTSPAAHGPRPGGAGPASRGPARRRP